MLVAGSEPLREVLQRNPDRCRSEELAIPFAARKVVNWCLKMFLQIAKNFRPGGKSPVVRANVEVHRRNG